MFKEGEGTAGHPRGQGDGGQEEKGTEGQKEGQQRECTVTPWSVRYTVAEQHAPEALQAGRHVPECGQTGRGRDWWRGTTVN